MKGTLKRICTARALLLAMIVISSLVAFAILCTHLYERMQQPYGSYNWSRKAIDDSIISGNNIIDLLYKYRDDNKVFPQNLTDLIPKYCSCIEMPKAGDKIWFYERDPTTTDSL